MIKSLATKVATSAEINQRTQVGTDCIVGSGSKIDERCSVKKSIIGQHCTIGKNCKISNSVIMGHVVIEDMVVLHGCIVCHNSTIHEKSNLKDVVVSTGYRVEANSVIKNEVLEDYHDD
jgi:translation initiation factor eIF-2B subunit gamma